MENLVIEENEERPSVIRPNFSVIFKTELRKLKQSSDSEFSSGEEFPGIVCGKPQPKLQKFATYSYVSNENLLQPEGEAGSGSSSSGEPEIKNDGIPDDLLDKFDIVIHRLIQSSEYKEFLGVLLQAFPDIDSEHLIYMLKLKELDNGECWATFKRMGLRGIFPKIKSIEEIKELERKKKLILDPSFTLKKLVDLFEGDPLAMITNVTLELDERYIRYARAQLVRDFPKITRTNINYELKEANFHYYPAYKALQRQVIKETSADDVRAVYENRPIIVLEEMDNPWEFKERLTDIPYKFPLIPDIDFYMEYTFVKQKLDYIASIKEIRDSKMEESSASAARVFTDCDLCSESGIVIQENLKCLVYEHAVCDYCIRAKALQVLKDVETPLIKCGVNNCNSVFPFPSIKRVLAPEVFTNWSAYVTSKQEKYNGDFPNDFKCISCYTYMLASLWISKCSDENCVTTKYQKAVLRRVSSSTATSNMFANVDVGSRWVFKVE